MKKLFHVLQQISFIFLILLLLTGLAAAQKAQSSPLPNSMEIGDDGVPVLIKHLPDWENAQKRALLTTQLQELQKTAGNRPVLNEIEFAGGTEAVTAEYDKARLVIVEFHTPQMAVEMDAKIQAKLTELNQPPTQTAYRKIGNYAVFVFDASDEQKANTLLDGVSYEKQVQWLGDNPYPHIAAVRKEREYIMTTGGIIVTVLQTAGIAVLLALGLGGVLGAVVFYRRRQQQALGNVYSDAGGMLRLNLDEIATQTSPSRLIENK